MVEIPTGSIEYLPVEITDRLGALTDLTGITVQSKVTSEDEATIVVDWADCSADGMIIKPLIDTSSGGFTKGSIYHLFVKVSIAPEFPILGPFEFSLV